MVALTFTGNSLSEDEEPLIADNTVINETIYFNLFECGKKFLNNLDSTYERAFMENSKDKHYSKMCNTLTDYRSDTFNFHIDPVRT